MTFRLFASPHKMNISPSVGNHLVNYCVFGIKHFKSFGVNKRSTKNNSALHLFIPDCMFHTQFCKMFIKATLICKLKKIDDKNIEKYTWHVPNL